MRAGKFRQGAYGAMLGDIRLPTTEAWIKTPASKSLSGRPSCNTKPEILLRRALHRLGVRYRIHTKIPGSRLSVDIDFRSAKVAVFVDGCFWHGRCPDHPRSAARGPNQAAWEAKFRSIAEREDRAGRLLSAAAYRVVRVHECRIKTDPFGVAGDIAAIVRCVEPITPRRSTAREAAIIPGRRPLEGSCSQT